MHLIAFDYTKLADIPVEVCVPTSEKLVSISNHLCSWRELTAAHYETEINKPDVWHGRNKHKNENTKTKQNKERKKMKKLILDSRNKLVIL